MACVCLPHGLHEQSNFNLGPPPGLEPMKISCSPDAMGGAVMKQDPLVALFEEYVRLRSDCSTDLTESKILQAPESLQVADLAGVFGSTGMNSFAPPKLQRPPGTFAPVGDTLNMTKNMTSPLKPPGLFEVSSPQVATPAVLAEHPLEADTTGRELRRERLGNGGVKVQWPVDAKKFNSKDKTIISPSFEISTGSSFKLMLKPLSAGVRKGQESFKKARGRGFVELKSMEDGTAMRLRISVGAGTQREPVNFDFSQNSVCRIGTIDEHFDFAAGLDPTSSTCVITLEVFPCDV